MSLIFITLEKRKNDPYIIRPINDDSSLVKSNYSIFSYKRVTRKVNIF